MPLRPRLPIGGKGVEDGERGLGLAKGSIRWTCVVCVGPPRPCPLGSEPHKRQYAIWDERADSLRAIVDVLFMPEKLLVFDVEGTLFALGDQLPGTRFGSTIWQALARALGEEAMQAERTTHEVHARNGYRNYIEWMVATIAIHQKFGLSKSLFDEVVASATYNPGVIETLRSVDPSKYEIALVSGGFTALSDRVQRDVAVRHSFAACHYLFDELGRLAGFNLIPSDFIGKYSFVKLLLEEYGLSVNDWVFVGDGANDIPIAKEAPRSIGYRPHPDLAAHVDDVITEFSQLSRLL